MKKLLFFPFLCLCLTLSAQIPIGTWRSHHSFDATYHLAVGPDHIYAASRSAVLSLDVASTTVSSLSRTSGLSDAGIATIAYDTSSASLLIAYNNANVDIVSGSSVFNISDIKRAAAISGDKAIYNISFADGKAFLACGFGIVIVDLLRHEIENTCYLNYHNEQLAVFDVAFTDKTVVAATRLGLFFAPRNDRYLNISNHWSPDTSSVLWNRTVVRLASLHSRLAALTQTPLPDSLCLFIQRHNGFVLADSGNICSLRAASDRWVVSEWDRIAFFDTSASRIAQFLDTTGWVNVMAHDAAIAPDGTLWVAHDWAGLVSFDLDGSRYGFAYAPQGPSCNDNVYKLAASDDNIYLCPGGKYPTYASMGRPAQLHRFYNEKWSSLSGPLLDSLSDIVDVAPSPSDTATCFAASWCHGIVQFSNGHPVQCFDSSNTAGALLPFHPSSGLPMLRTAALAFDRKGDLWATNSLSSKAVAVRHSDGSWQGFDTYAMTADNELDMILCDSIHDYKFFAGRANRIFVLDNEGRMAFIDPNNGSKLQTSSVKCITQDRLGDIWVGTNKGIKVIFDAYKAFNNGGHGEKSPVNCSNIIIGNGQFVEYLMAYENISCIAVDGANRKWVGTAAGGLYLLSPNGLEELQHFTVANSPLPSNKIVSLAISPRSGELFVGTDFGLYSYRSTATDASVLPLDDDQIHAFPNPVRPNYDGPIAIKGFSRDAYVHITDAAGHVVFSTQALGGQAVWSGRTNSGARVASGTYFVFAADAQGNNKSVTKILVIH